MENGKDLYHLLEMDELMNVVGGATTVNTGDIHVCNPSPEPGYIIDDDGNHHYAPTPSPSPSPAPGTGNPGNPPNNGNNDGGNGDIEDTDEPVDGNNPSEPTDPVDGSNPPEPGDPVDDYEPWEPDDPIDGNNPPEPGDPVDDYEPWEPDDPVDGNNPSEPTDPVDGNNPPEPTDPVEGNNPSEPTDPVDGNNPPEPGNPVDGNNPPEPTDPVEGNNPSEPTDPVDGNNPSEPGNPVDGNNPTNPVNPPTDNSGDDGGNDDSSDGTPDNGDEETGENINLPTDDDGNNETGTGGQTNTPPAANNTTQTTQAADAGPKPLSPSERARMALFSKRKSSEDDFYNDAIGGTKKDILDKYTNKKPSSLVVARDIKGQDVTFDDFKVDAMDISIKREHDGYGNKFDSVRTIETVRLANGQVVKCNIQDMVGANAESKAFADKHKGRILPDGKYFFTAAGLTKQKDGTYNSACFQNTLRLQTKDSNIPEHIRNDINSKYFLFHATEYKEGYIPEDGKCRIWIEPWSAGCISSITGGQATHDDFMNMLTGITPENISITITSKKHVNI